jgi:outer membrane protein assembly factor BamD (BamD/ComL family)
MSRAQDATTRREWREALQAVETVIARFPDSAEAHDLRLQLPTLRANVEIQARHEMETTIRDLIRDQRFSEALRIARELIARYPDSPQAAVLREQLHRLEQRAAEIPAVK